MKVPVQTPGSNTKDETLQFHYTTELYIYRHHTFLAQALFTAFQATAVLQQVQHAAVAGPVSCSLVQRVRRVVVTYLVWCVS